MAEDNSLVWAVIENDIDWIKTLPNDGWYQFSDPCTGDTLLHVAVNYKRDRIFDYLLSIPGFWINAKNNCGATVLDVCLDRHRELDDHFALKLFQRGAQTNRFILPPEDTLLHYTIKFGLNEVSKFLIQTGDDVNAEDREGITPMWSCLDRHTSSTESAEVGLTLMLHGADLTLGQYMGYNFFEWVVYRGTELFEEIVFYFMFDEYASIDIRIETLLFLSVENSKLFPEVLERVRNVIVTDSSLEHYYGLFDIDVCDLKMLIKRCPNAIRELLSQSNLSECLVNEFNDAKFIENADILLESELRDATIDFMCSLNDKLILLGHENDESTALKYLCFFLSYGLELNKFNLTVLYGRFGYGELIKTALHTDIGRPHWFKFAFLYPFVDVLCDVHSDIERILGTYRVHRSRRGFWELLPYFSRPRLRELCQDKDGESEVSQAIKNQPKVPSLLELARNATKKSIVNKFNVQSASQYYTLIKHMDMSVTYKRILTYERKLYSS